MPAHKTANLASVCVACLLLAAGARAAVPDGNSPFVQAVKAAKQSYLGHDYDAAAAKYQEAAKLAPSKAMQIVLLANLGASLREGHKFDQAEQAFKKAIALAEQNHLERDPSAINAMRQYAALLTRLGRNMDAQSMAARASGQAPGGGGLNRAAQPIAPIEFSSAPDSADESSADNHAEASKPAGSSKKGDYTVAELQKLVTERPDDGRVWMVLAHKLAEEKDYAGAIKRYLTIITRFPQYAAQAHSDASRAYRLSGQTEQAVEQAKLAIDGDPKSTMNYLLLISYLIDAGDVKSAMETEQQFLDKFPDDSHASWVLNSLNDLKTQGGQKDADRPTAHELAYRWPRSYMPLKVFVPVTDQQLAPTTSGMSERTPLELVQHACADWTQSSEGRVQFRFVDRAEDANIEFMFTENPNGLEEGDAGLTQWNRDFGSQFKARITILLINNTTGRAQPPERVLHTAVHELGHALQLSHSSHPEDVMYPVQNADQVVIDPSSNDAKRVSELYNY